MKKNQTVRRSNKSQESSSPNATQTSESKPQALYRRIRDVEAILSPFWAWRRVSY